LRELAKDVAVSFKELLSHARGLIPVLRAVKKFFFSVTEEASLEDDS
jgi:hypothetical protein